MVPPPPVLDKKPASGSSKMASQIVAISTFFNSNRARRKARISPPKASAVSPAAASLTVVWIEREKGEKI